MASQCHRDLFWHRHKLFQHQQKISCCHTYTENEEAWLVQMQLTAILFQIQCIPFMFIAVLPINLWYKYNYGCRSGYLPYRPEKNQKLRIGHCWKLFLKSPFFYTGKKKKHGALCPQKPLRLGVENFISNTYPLHCHHQNDSALRWAVVWTILMFH